MRAREAAVVLPLLLLVACGDAPTAVSTVDVDPQRGVTESTSGKVAVCHRDVDIDSWHMILVSASASRAHLAHGDVLPGDLVPGVDQILDADCVPYGWEILVSEVGSQTIRRISSDGLSSSVFANIPSPRGIAVEQDGSVVFVELTGRLWRTAPDGSNPTAFFGGLSGASGVAVMPNGDLVVTEDHSPYRLVRVAPDGSTWSVVATGIKSEDVEVDEDGNLIVLQELSDGQLLKVTPSGAITVLLTGLVAPVDLAIDEDGSIVLAEWGPGIVRRIAPDGSVTLLASGLTTVEGLAIQPDGSLLAAEYSPGRLIEIAGDGSSSSVFFTGLARPDHLAVRLVR